MLGVGAIVVRESALLLVRRGRAPAQGLWSLPGGRVEQGERLEDALQREVKEETGLDVAVGRLAGLFEVPGTDEHYVVADYFAEVTGEVDPIAGTDAAEARWVPFEDLESLECTPHLVETLAGWGVLPGQK